MAAPVLRPGAGFCIQSESTGSPPARWFVNMCKHKLVDMPVAYSGMTVTREWILQQGIACLQVPFDMGSFRKLKLKSDGAKQTTYCVDVIFNPFIIQLFMEDEFCNLQEKFRPYVINLALKRIEESIGVQLSNGEKCKLVKSLRYKDGEDGGDVPREFQELTTEADSFDAPMPEKSPPQEEKVVEEPLIQDLTPGKSKPAIKKGFLNNKEAKALYPNGSKEGVIPENAGDPMGWMPKKLRNSAKIVDCNSPEYQKHQKEVESVNRTNASNQEFRDTMGNDMMKWAKKRDGDGWGEDSPEGTEAPVKIKYNNDYSRFDDIEDAPEPTGAEERDWYCDEKGKTHYINNQKKATPAVNVSDVNAVDMTDAEENAAMFQKLLAEQAKISGKPPPPAVKKGFFDDAKKSLYPEGSTEGTSKFPQQQSTPQDDEKLLKDLQNLMGPDGMPEHLREAVGSAPKSKSAAKVIERKVPEFKLNEQPDALQLVVSVPGLTGMQGVTLDVTERRASLAFPSAAGFKPLQVELPVEVLPTGARAKFSKKSQTVTVTMPSA